MQIIPATPSHMEACMKINAEFGTPYDNPEWFIAESIEQDRVIIAEIDEKVVGYLLYQIIWGNTQLLSLIKVTKTAQHQGIGQILLEKFLEKMKKTGYKKVISSTEKKNGQGQNFHQKNGFEHIGELEMIYGEELFFAKTLS